MGKSNRARRSKRKYNNWGKTYRKKNPIGDEGKWMIREMNEFQWPVKDFQSNHQKDKSKYDRKNKHKDTHY